MTIYWAGIPCFHINKIAFLLKPLNFADSHYFNHALISGITVSYDVNVGTIKNSTCSIETDFLHEKSLKEQFTCCAVKYVFANSAE